MLVLVTLTCCDSRQVEELDLSERIDDRELTRAIYTHDGNSLRFGFDLRSSPEEDARQYLPFLNYLESATGLHFELRFTTSNQDIAYQLGSGEFQLAAIGGETYIQAHAKYDVIPLVRGLNTEGRAEYRSVMVVAPNSPIRSIEELRGKRLAFGSADSTQGYLIPRILLYEHAISLDDLAAHTFTGSHKKCVNAVITRHFDACGMQDILGQRMSEEGHVRIIHTSEAYPSSGIAANKDVVPEVIEKVKRALLDFKPTGAHAENLYHWERTEMVGGFVEASDADYANLREWAIKFDLLHDAPVGIKP